MKLGTIVISRKDIEDLRTKGFLEFLGTNGNKVRIELKEGS